MGDISGGGKKQLKVLIADDSALIRKQLKVLLSRIEGVVISGTAEDGVEALRQVRELNPNVVVLDIGMPRKSGVEVLKEIRRENHATVIIMYTADLLPKLRELCLEAGANFFLHKTQFKELIGICERLQAN
jgi:two-component system response regulator NreC